MNLNAKLAYLLCTCDKFNDSFMAAMSKQYEKNKIIATRHYFTLYINLYEPNTEEYKDKFAVENVNFKFAGSSDIILADALQSHNNEILSIPEMKIIYENLKKQNILLNAFQIIGIYTIASLIKYYIDAKFKYIFIPVVINYGRDVTSVHQGALIIDFNGYFLFYEPYGKYIKYNKSYSESVCNLFRVFNIPTLFNINSNDTYNIQCITYHKYLRLDEGIQNIILNRNNARSSTFNIEYNKLVDEIQSEFPSHNFKPDSNRNDKDDYTTEILDLLFNMDKSNIKFSDTDKKEKYDKILNKVLENYCCYNSKTCVTITLVELNYFFKNCGMMDNVDSISDKLKILYSKFQVEKPNHILMNMLNELFNIFHNSDDIKEIIINNSSISGICNKLFKSKNNGINEL